MKMKWLTPRRQVYIAAALLAIAAYLLISRRSLPRPTAVGAIGTEVCNFRYDQLPSMVWSHRAHFDETSVDGSAYSVGNLLNSGVRNFDVDVSCRRLSALDPCEFIVAHPTVAASGNSEVQSVTAFLLQIYNYCKEHDGLIVNGKVKLRPAVTLEMKFTGSAEQISFVQLVQQSPLADHVAIIGADPLTLAGIVPHIRRGGIAAAYRTLPLTDHDYNWPATTVPQDTAVHTLQLTPLVKYALEAATSEQHIIATVEEHSQTLVLPAPVSAAEEGQGLLQVYMPDFKLVKQRVAVPTRQVRTDGGVTLVVPWVVDDEPVMWDLLAHKDVDAVISNRPVQLLRALRSAHSQLC